MTDLPPPENIVLIVQRKMPAIHFRPVKHLAVDGRITLFAEDAPEQFVRFKTGKDKTLKRRPPLIPSDLPRLRLKA